MRNRSDNFRLSGCGAGARHNGSYGFPLWGKLSPQVTDEGEPSGHLPLIRRASAPPSPQGEGFPRRIHPKTSKKGRFRVLFALYQLYKIIPRPLFRGRSCAPPPTKFCGPRCFAHQNECRRFPPTAWCRPRGWWAGSSKSYPPQCRSRDPRAG